MLFMCYEDVCVCVISKMLGNSVRFYVVESSVIMV